MTFMLEDWKDFDIESGIKMGGVIPFNRYGSQSKQLIMSLYN